METGMAVLTYKMKYDNVQQELETDTDKENIMRNHLPLLGAGPAYVSVITLTTITVLTLKYRASFEYGDFPVFRIPFFLMGSFLIASAVLLWGKANFQSKIRENILKNHLVTTGIYASVRNPILSGHLLANTGVFLFTCNLLLMIFPLFYWIYMTLLLRATEEKWLRALYGQKYVEYCKKVNRCIPWFRRRNSVFRAV